MELSLDDPNISVESDDVIYEKRKTHNKKRKKLKSGRTSKIHQNNLLNESGEEGDGEDEFNTQEQRTPTKKRRNIYYPGAINDNKNNNNCQYNGGDSNSYNDNNDNNDHNYFNQDYNDNDNHAHPVHASNSQKEGDKGTLENTDMVRYP